MKNIKALIASILIIVGLTSCQVTTYGGVKGRVASTPFYSGSSASWDWNPFERNKILTKNTLSLLPNEFDEKFKKNYIYCYYKFSKAKRKGEHLIINDCKDAYELSKKLCFEEKNMLHCVSTRNLATDIYNDERVADKAKKYLKYKNPKKLDFKLNFY